MICTQKGPSDTLIMDGKHHTSFISGFVSPHVRQDVGANQRVFKQDPSFVVKAELHLCSYLGAAGIETTMLCTLSLVIAVAASTVLARPAADCTTYRSGYLAARPDPTFGFTLNAEGQLAYTGTGTGDALFVEYQACESLAPGNPDNTDVPGRFFVPSKQQCLKVVNQEDETGPYFTGLADCDTSYPFRFDLRTSEGGHDFYFGGYSDEEGTILQGGCGLLGFEVGADGLPVTTDDHEVSIVCDGRKAFQVVLP